MCVQELWTMDMGNEEGGCNTHQIKKNTTHV